jgi:zinc carboxypeptidase
VNRIYFALILLSAAGLLFGQQAPLPADHFGFELGADGRLASWPAIVDYYRQLATASDRVEVRELGRTTLDRPFLLVTISSVENLARAERLAEISRRVADPRGLSDSELDRLVDEGKSVVAVTAGLHSTEVAATQMAPGLAWRLATADDPDTLRILDQAVFLLFPCFNPDGTQMVVEWAEKTRGTKYEGAGYPDLYHHYAGHDDNRDAYALNLNESRMFAQVVYRDWIPQLYLDVHQMGSYGARLYVPPYHDPINPNVDPLLWMEHELIGANMQIALERAGVSGVVAGAPYTGWWFPSFHMVTNHHNIAGMLTETASARLAWPIYIHPHQLQPHGRSHSVYEPMQVFPHPWPGGWWRLRDLIHQQEVSTYALLATAARNREMFLRNMAFKARRTIERAGDDAPWAYLIRAAQQDPRTVEKLVGTLMRNGIEVHQAAADFEVGQTKYAKGDFVVSLAQPNGVVARSLLAEARYPDNASTRRADDSILRPYDMAQFVLAEHMGVEATPVDEELTLELRRLDEAPKSTGRVRESGDAGWLLSQAFNDSFRVTNRLLSSQGDVYWLREAFEQGGEQYAPGTVWIPGGTTTASAIGELANEFGLPFRAVASAPAGPKYKLQKLRLGMYRRYQGGNMDEGWTRLLFDRWEFPYERVTADDINGGALERLDVLLIPHDSLRALKGEEPKEDGEEAEEEEYPRTFLPPEYRKGLDKDAIRRLREFVRGGGGLVLLNGATALALEELGVPVENVVEGLPTTEYFCPGSTLRAQFDTSHPLAYGMPDEGLILNAYSPSFRIRPSALNAQIAAPILYANRDILKSGWLIGEQRIASKAAALDVAYGKGRIILIGFRPQHRAQIHGTFKVLFNALYYSSAEESN